jgi:hypothetical protein
VGVKERGCATGEGGCADEREREGLRHRRRLTRATPVGGR